MTKLQKIKEMKEKNNLLNIISHVPMYLQLLTPLAYSAISKNYEHFQNLILNSEGNLSTNFIIGVGIGTVGALLKQTNDKNIEKIIDTDGKNLLKKGFYSKIRHPCYAFQEIISTSFTIMFPTWYNGLFLATDYFLKNKLAKEEEKTAKYQFGKEYEDYMKKVPRWFPKISFRKAS